jgi:hypothetical protein
VARSDKTKPFVHPPRDHILVVDLQGDRRGAALGRDVGNGVDRPRLSRELPAPPTWRLETTPAG